MEIRRIPIEELSDDMFADFHHYQHISRKWAKSDENWILCETDEVREWNAEKRRWIPGYLREQLQRGGTLLGAFYEGDLIGFACADGLFHGDEVRYANLTMLFVDDRWQRKGIGKALFKAMCRLVSVSGADKLFISAIPSEETIAFYFSMGCLDADRIIAEFVDTEYDRYLEFQLNCE